MNNQSISSVNQNVFTPLQNNDVTYPVTKSFVKNHNQQIENEKDKKTNKLGYDIAKVALLAGFGVWALMKGTPKGVKQNITKFLTDKIAEVTVKNKQLSALQRMYTKTLEFTNAAFNLASLKDVLVKKIMEIHPKLSALGDNITGFFERVSVLTSKHVYSKTLVNLDTMLANFNAVNQVLIEKNPKLAGELADKMNAVEKIYENNFRESARNSRLVRIKQSMDRDGKPLYQHFWDETYGHIRQFLTNKNTYTKFISEELVAGTKKDIQDEVAEVSSNIRQELENIVRSYRESGALTDKQIKQLNNSVNRTTNSLNSAINTETDKLFDKVRDLKIGSALNDTLAILTSLGVVGWGLSKADNNDERTSIALKYGIPVIGSILTSSLFAFALVPAGPALLYGLIVGTAINKLGAMADDARKRYQEKKPIVDLPDIDLTSPIKNIEDIKNANQKSKKD